MISNNAKLQSLELKFSFQTQPDKLIVQATSSKFNEEFVGQIPAHPCTDFQLIKQMIEEGEFKTLIKTQELLKIRIGAIILEMFPTQKIQIKDVKQALQKSLKKQTELQNIIQSQKNKIDEHELFISDLRKTVEEMKSTPKISALIMEELKQELTNKANGMENINHKIQNKCSSVQINLNEINMKFSSNQKLVEQLLNKVKAAQQREEGYKIIIQNLKNDVNNLKNEFKVYQFDSTLQKRLIDSQQIINKHPIIKQLTEEVIKTYESQRLQKQRQQKQRQQSQRQQKQRQDIQRLQKFQKFMLAKIKEQNEINKYHQQLSQSFIWSEELKHQYIKVTGNVIKYEGLPSYYRFCLLKAGFTKNLRQKQCWGIKTNSCGKLVVGVYKMDLTKTNNFFRKQAYLIKQNQEVYGINNEGLSFSCSHQQFNNKQTNFQFYRDNIVTIEYDPIKGQLKFFNNSNQKCNTYIMPVSPILQGFVYQPCACISSSFNILGFSSDSLMQIIYPIKPIKQ